MGAKTAEITVIDDDEKAHALAERLNQDHRTRPIVVISTPAGLRKPRIDAEEIVSEVGDVAEVFVLRTGSPSWSFSRTMPELTQVYGGAGRVYPVGLEWVALPRLSPLRFAFHDREARAATDALVADALAMASAAGLFDRPATAPVLRTVSGTVKGLPHPERAWIACDDRSHATAISELIVPGVPLSRLVSTGQRVTGLLDPSTHRLDLRGSVLTADSALADYAVGAVVLAEVEALSEAVATLRLHPSVAVDVRREQVSPNEHDTVDSLFTVGEVVLARVTALNPCELSLLDVEDDEEPLPAAPALPGGPPWLLPPVWEIADAPEVEPGAPEEPEDWAGEEVSFSVEESLAEHLTLEPETEEEEPEAPEPGQPVTPIRRGPDPRLFDPVRRGQVAASVEPETPAPPAAATTPAPGGGAVRTLTITVDGLRATQRELDKKLAAQTDRIADLTRERDALRSELSELDRDLRRANHEVKVAKAQRRKGVSSSAHVAERPEFADAERGFRHEVEEAWARRIPVAEQPALPLPAYDLGPRFLDSLGTPGVARAKVVDVVVEVLIGRADRMPGREVHQLREGTGGGAAGVKRSSDDATCWRVALQVNTPQARRLHFWRLPGGTVELSRVVLHDDMEP